jgi:hypothetical protein
LSSFDDLISSSLQGTEVVIAERRGGDALLHDAEVLWRPDPRHGIWWHEEDGDAIRGCENMRALARWRESIRRSYPRADILFNCSPGPDRGLSAGTY